MDDTRGNISLIVTSLSWSLSSSSFFMSLALPSDCFFISSHVSSSSKSSFKTSEAETASSCNEARIEKQNREFTVK